MDKRRIEAINALLPQTQCTRCGYPDCRSYASAVEHEQASYNQCPPGGQIVVKRLAELLGKPEIDLNPEYGTEGQRTTAVIDEQRCIGCTLCIHACPVDAIVGSAKHMHTVLRAYCTGCNLCLAPCPVDCIDMVPLHELAASGSAVAAQLVSATATELSDAARSRYEAHKIRIARHNRKQSKRLKARDITGHQTQKSNTSATSNARKNAVIAAALKRARARRLAHENLRFKTD